MTLFQWKKVQESYLALDIGAEAIKALIFHKQGTRIVVDAAAAKELDSGKDAAREAAFKAIEEVGRQAAKKPERLLLELPASILKARIIKEGFQRKKPEEVISKKEKEEILQQILKQGRDKLSRDIAAASGILAQEFYFTDFEILETKIDGYSVAPELLGYAGKILEFKILAVFLLKDHLKSFQRLFQPLSFKKIFLLHKAQGIVAYLPSAVLGPNRIFLDIGGETTQYFLIRKGGLDRVGEFHIGGRDFSDALSQVLGLPAERAQEFKERYAKGLLSEPVRSRIKEILAPVIQDWSRVLKSELGQNKGLFPVSVFGGSCLLPEIQEVIEETLSPDVKTYVPKDFKEIEKGVDVLPNSPVYTNCLFLCCYHEK